MPNWCYLIDSSLISNNDMKLSILITNILSTCLIELYFVSWQLRRSRFVEGVNA